MKCWHLSHPLVVKIWTSCLKEFARGSTRGFLITTPMTSGMWYVTWYKLMQNRDRTATNSLRASFFKSTQISLQVLIVSTSHSPWHLKGKVRDNQTWRTLLTSYSKLSMYLRILRSCNHIFQGVTMNLWRQIDSTKELANQKHSNLSNKNGKVISRWRKSYRIQLHRGEMTWLRGQSSLLNPTFRTRRHWPAAQISSPWFWRIIRWLVFKVNCKDNICPRLKLEFHSLTRISRILQMWITRSKIFLLMQIRSSQTNPMWWTTFETASSSRESRQFRAPKTQTLTPKTATWTTIRVEHLIWTARLTSKTSSKVEENHRRRSQA